MAKGAYDINETKVGPTKDGSFRSMLCAMLVFVAICGIIIIVAWPWKNSAANEKKVSSGNSLGTNYKRTEIESSNKPKEDNVNPQSVETFKKDKPSLSTTNSPRKNENIIVEPVQSTTPPYDDNSTLKTEKPSKPVNHTETTLIPGAADLSNHTKSDNKFDAKNTTSNTTVNPNSDSEEVTTLIKDDKINTNSSQPRNEDLKSMPSMTTLTPENESTTLQPTTSTNETIKNDNDNSTTGISIGSKDDKVTTNSPVQSGNEATKLVPSITTLTPENESTTLQPTTSTNETIKNDKDNSTTGISIGSKDDKVTTNSPVQSGNEDTKSAPSITTLTPENESTTLQPTTSTNETIKNDKDNSTTGISIGSKDDKVTTNSPVQSGNEDTKTVPSITTLTPENESTTLQPTTSTNETIKNDKDNSTTVISKDSKDDKVTTNSPVQSGNEDTKTVPSITTLTPENESTTLPTTTTVTPQNSIEQTEKVDSLVINKHNNTLIVITTPTPVDESTTLQPTTSTNETKKNDIDNSTTVISKDSKDDKVTTNSPVQSGNEDTKTVPSITTLTPVDESTTLPTTQNNILETDSIDHSTRITAPPTIQNQNIDECKAECKEVGARILSQMKHSADPCEQFYDYACGSDNNDNALEDNWKRIAEGLDRIQQQSPDVYKTFQKFYESCVDFHTDYNYGLRLFEARDILSTVGQPFVKGVDEDSALTDLLTRLLQLDSSPLFDISVDVDTQTKYFVFQLNIGKRFSTLLNDNSAMSLKRKCVSKAKKQLYFSSSSDYMNLNEMQNVYLNCMKNGTYKTEAVEEALDSLNYYTELEPSIEHIGEIVEKYMEFASAASIRKDIITKQFVVKKVSELEFHYPLIKWKQILTNLVGRKVHDEDLVQVYFKDFFFTLFSRKQTLTKPQLYNAILTMYINDLYANLVLPTPMENPEEFCLHHASDLMKEVASSLYLEPINQKEYEGDLNRVEDLFRKMKTKLQDLIQNDADWLNGAPKISLIKKINKMALDTAWDKTLLWKNITLLQERMESINRTYGNYSDFAAALVTRNRQMLYNMWDTMAYLENNVWWHFLTPYSTNPVSIYTLNTIAIPPAMLFTNSKEIPRYLSLAHLGYNLAKAVGYHFDSTGSRYEINLDNKAQAAYREAETCIKAINFDKELKVEHAGQKLQFQVNEESLNLTLNERFVENLAINLLSKMSNEDVTDYKISWVASNPDLEKVFSREKMFFIALGQEHCRKSSIEDYFLHVFESEHLPSSLVLDITLSHSELFKEVFDCKGGSRMNVELKCNAFPTWDEPDPDQYEDYN